MTQGKLLAGLPLSQNTGSLCRLQLWENNFRSVTQWLAPQKGLGPTLGRAPCNPGCPETPVFYLPDSHVSVSPQVRLEVALQRAD